MQLVSKEYQESMKSSLRERSYMMLFFALVNQNAQTHAKIEIMEGHDVAYYSNDSLLFTKDTPKDKFYATMETNFTRLDGSMMFLPRKDTAPYYNTGFISHQPLSSTNSYNFIFKIKFGTTLENFKGLTIDFGENYPTEFSIIINGDQTLRFKDNDKSLWRTEEEIKQARYIVFQFERMKHRDNRVRIYSIFFGQALFYTNEEIINTALTSYISPIAENIPQIDFKVQLKNYDKYFDFDNPESPVHFLKQGQKMIFTYGYMLPRAKQIEWLPETTLFVSSWETDDNFVTINCQDVLRSLEDDFDQGVVDDKSYFELAEEILEDAGISHYNIDPFLQDFNTNNPVPKMKHKEALQLIANACNSTLSQNRNGDIEIKPNITAKKYLESNGETHFSTLNTTQIESEKYEYALFNTDFMSLDGKMRFLPKNAPYLDVGYVSEGISLSNGYFLNKPVITIKTNHVLAYRRLRIIFGATLPTVFYIRTYNSNVNGKNDEYLVDTFMIRKEDGDISRETTIIRDFKECKRLEIEFVHTEKPENPIIVKQLYLDDHTNFHMEKEDIISSIKAIKPELVQKIIVPYCYYKEGGKKDNLLSQDIHVTEWYIDTFYMQEPSYGYVIKLDGQVTPVIIKSQSAYQVTLFFTQFGKHKLEIEGYRYKKIQKQVVKKLNDHGKIITWENPLIDSKKAAENLAEYLTEYYSSDIEFEYDSRGNPEIDVNDVVYQENNFRKDMNVTIYEYSLDFDGALSAKVKTREKKRKETE